MQVICNILKDISIRFQLNLINTTVLAVGVYYWAITDPWMVTSGARQISGIYFVFCINKQNLKLHYCFSRISSYAYYRIKSVFKIIVNCP